LLFAIAVSGCGIGSASNHERVCLDVPNPVNGAGGCGSGPGERHQGSHHVQAGRPRLSPRLWRQSPSLQNEAKNGLKAGDIATAPGKAAGRLGSPRLQAPPRGGRLAWLRRERNSVGRRRSISRRPPLRSRGALGCRIGFAYEQGTAEDLSAILCRPLGEIDDANTG
jgi:hypothetical protein